MTVRCIDAFVLHFPSCVQISFPFDNIASSVIHTDLLAKSVKEVGWWNTKTRMKTNKDVYQSVFPFSSNFIGQPLATTVAGENMQMSSCNILGFSCFYYLEMWILKRKLFLVPEWVQTSIGKEFEINKLVLKTWITTLLISWTVDQCSIYPSSDNSWLSYLVFSGRRARRTAQMYLA